MNIEPAFTVLRREQLLIDHAPHSVQFERLTGQLLRACSAAAVIPPLTTEDIRLYAALALLHDIGKRAVPPKILNKPGPLTEEEFAVMKSHTTQGCELLERIPELRECEAFPAICDVCRHHHERWDGSGCPDRLAGKKITPWVHKDHWISILLDGSVSDSQIVPLLELSYDSVAPRHRLLSRRSASLRIFLFRAATTMRLSIPMPPI